MQIPKIPQVFVSRLDSVMSALGGGIPEPTERGPAKRPYERAKAVTQKASAQCAAVSGSLAMPVGPLGMLTILPDLAFVWKIQTQMVVDIAAAFGHKGNVTQQQLLTCLFKHVADTATREYEKSIPLEHEKPRTSLLLDVIDRVSAPKSTALALPLRKQVGQALMRATVRRAASRIVPLAGAAVVATYSALDTKEVARTAIELFSGEKLPARKTRKEFPSAEEMFEVDTLKEIDPNEF